MEVAVGENYSSSSRESCGKSPRLPVRRVRGVRSCPIPPPVWICVLVLCSEPLLMCIYFLPLPPHRGCHRRSTDRGPPLLLSGWTPRWPRCGAWRPLEAFLREWVSDRSFSCWLGRGWKLRSGLGALWLGTSAHLFAMSLAMLRVLPSWDARGARHKSFT